MSKRYQAVYSGDLPENDLSMVRYTAHYTSDPWQYLISATVTYKQKENIEDSSSEKSWYLLLAVLAAVSVGLQVALIFVLAMHRR